jgi:hypothetical protein
MARVRKNDAICLIGLKLHILDHGSTFNLHSRVAAAAPALERRVEGGELGDRAAKRGTGKAGKQVSEPAIADVDAE